MKRKDGEDDHLVGPLPTASQILYSTDIHRKGKKASATRWGWRTGYPGPL